MSELLKLIKSLMKKGVATVAEKAQVAKLLKALDDGDAEVVADEAAAVAALPEEAVEEPTDEDVDAGIKALFSKHAKSVTDEVTEKVKTFMSEQNELIAKQAGAYHPDLVTKRKGLNATLRETCKYLLRGDEAKLKEMTTDESGTPYAGYTVDSELSAEIQHLVSVYGVARREMQSIQLTKHEYKANNLATDVSVYWVDEGAVVSSTQAVLGQETLTLKKLGAIITVTAELLEDTEIDFMSFLAARVAEGFALAEDQAFFVGNGTGTFGGFTGVLRNTSTNNVAMATGQVAFTNLTADLLLDMQDATPAGALPNAKYYYHRSIKSIVRKLKDDNGAYIYQAPSQQGPATVWGMPEVLVESMPAIAASGASTAFVLFGDLRKAAIFGYKGSINAARFQGGTVRNVAADADINLITTDREAVRWTERVGYVTIVPKAVTRLTTGAAA